jgi:hypothetical protein
MRYHEFFSKNGEFGACPGFGQNHLLDLWRQFAYASHVHYASPRATAGTRHGCCTMAEHRIGPDSTSKKRDQQMPWVVVNDG